MAVTINKEELYVGEYCDVLQLTISGTEAVDLSSAQAVKMFQKSPANVESEISNITAVGTSVLSHTIISSEFNEQGMWKVQGYAQMPATGSTPIIYKYFTPVYVCVKDNLGD